jgi:hypothetical protein
MGSAFNPVDFVIRKVFLLKQHGGHPTIDEALLLVREIEELREEVKKLLLRVELMREGSDE